MLKKKFDDSLFEKAINNFDDADAIRRPSISYWNDVWQRLKKNKLAISGLFMLIFIVFFATVGPWLNPITYAFYDPTTQEVTYAFKHAFDNTPAYAYQNYEHIYEGVSSQFWLGTDSSGRDTFIRLAMGTRISLAIGLTAALINLLVGVTVGGIAGYKGGWVDNFLMRSAEILYALPYMLTTILIMLVLGNGVFTMIFAITLTSWVPTARLVRGQVMQIKEFEYVQASKAFGANSKWILLKHLIPNAMGPIIVNITLTVPVVIFSEATLSFLGLGIPAPLPSLGTMANDALQATLIGQGQLLLYPSLVISMIMFGFNVLGDGLRDALDPKLRK